MGGVGELRESEGTLDDDYASLFTAYHRWAYRVALLMCGNAVLAEDIVSEAFVRIYPAWKRGRIDSFPAYLRRTVINEANMTFRRRRLESREAALAMAESSPAPLTDDRSAEHGTLLAALRQLPPKQRAAVVLRIYEDLSERETAHVLGTTVGTVKAHTSRGLERLRALLEGEN